jgi:hypothetical protein
MKLTVWWDIVSFVLCTALIFSPFLQAVAEARVDFNVKALSFRAFSRKGGCTGNTDTGMVISTR